MQRLITTVVLCAGILGSTTTAARDVRIQITNLTNATYFTPLLVAAHDAELHLFQPGQAASAHLQAMAEGGDISGLASDVEAAGGAYVADPAGGMLAPGASTTAMLDTRKLTGSHLSIVGMLLPTNDGFVGMDGAKIPFWPGTYSYFLNAYDAGTEANDEIVNGGASPGTPGVPADPGGRQGTGATGAAGADANPTVHIHRGVLGDQESEGGPSDLDSRIHRWDNPVARVVIHVAKPGG
jgi:hypothetical protein